MPPKCNSKNIRCWIRCDICFRIDHLFPFLGAVLPKSAMETMHGVLMHGDKKAGNSHDHEHAKKREEDEKAAQEKVTSTDARR